jgi:hypothetical protein
MNLVEPGPGYPGQTGIRSTPTIKDFYAFQADRLTTRLTWRLLTPEWLTLRVIRKIDGGDWVTLDKVHRGEHYVDGVVPLGSLNRSIQYGLVIEGRSDIPEVVADLNDTRRDPRAASITRKERMLLRRKGFPVAWFALRSEGPRCKCFNIVTERIEDDNCEICMGTGRVGGYSDPVVIYMAGESPKQRGVMLAEVGEIEQSMRHLWTTAEWRLRNRDVLITAGGSRYRIDGIVQNSLAESPTRQVATCLEINPGDVEFNLELPEKIHDILLRQPGKGVQL